MSDDLAATVARLQAELAQLQAAAAPAAPAAPGRCKSTREAEAYLRAQGWRADHTTLVRATRAGKIQRDAEGGYLHATLDTWALAHGKRLDFAEPADEKASRIAREKAEEELLKTRAERERRELQLGRERGQLISRGDAERALAARALQLRGDVEGWAHEVPLSIVDRFGLPAEALPELRSLLLAAAKEWLGRYAEEREWAQLVPDERAP